MPSAKDLPVRKPKLPLVARPTGSPSLSSALLPSASASPTLWTSSVTSRFFSPAALDASRASRPRKSPLSGLTKRSSVDSKAVYSTDSSVPTSR